MSNLSVHQAARLGLRPIELPLDERRTVNAILIEGEPLTLLDTGLGTVESLTRLREGLARLGYRLADLEQIVITHAHLDHFGAAAAIARESGAVVLGDAGGADAMAHFEAAWEETHAYRLALFAGAGAPRQVIEETIAWGQVYARLGQPITLNGLIAPGDPVQMGGRRWQSLSVPGHAASSLAFFDPIDGALLSGDILVGIGAANVTLHPVGDGRLPASWQPTIADSLRRLRALAPRLIVPGHGPEISDAPAAIQDRLARIDSRLEQTRALLGQAPRPAYQLSLDLYGSKLGNSLFGLSQAIGYLDALECAGEAQAEERAGVRVYALTD